MSMRSGLSVIIFLMVSTLSVSPASVDLCNGKCPGPTGIAINSDSKTLYVLSTESMEGILQKWALNIDNNAKVNLSLLSSCQKRGGSTEMGPPGPDVLLFPQGVVPLEFFGWVSRPALILVADSANHRILSLNNCPASTIAVEGDGKPGSTLNSPTALAIGVFSPAFDAFVNLIFVADTDNNRIQVYKLVEDTTGNSIFKLFDSSTTWQLPKPLNHPQGLALDPVANLLYIMDTGNGLVDVLRLPSLPKGPLSGEKPRFLVSFTAEGTAIAVSRGGLFIVNTLEDSVQVHDHFTGKLLYTFTKASDGTKFVSPRGIAIDNVGRVYVSDFGNNRVVLLPTN